MMVTATSAMRMKVNVDPVDDGVGRVGVGGVGGDVGRVHYNEKRNNS